MAKGRVWGERSPRGTLVLLAMTLVGCDVDTEKWTCTAVGLIAMIVGIRWLVRYETRHEAKRRALLRDGVAVMGVLDGLRVVSGPGAAETNPTSSVRLVVKIEGGQRVTLTEFVPSHRVGALREGLQIALRHAPGRPETAVVDWERTPLGGE